MKLGYLGPKGTFSEQAAMMYAAKCPYDCEYEMFLNITDVISAVGDGIIDEGIVPLENSIEGTVTSTVDTLIFDAELYINSELILSVNQNLMVKKGVCLNDVKKIISHPQGLAQCRNDGNFGNRSRIVYSGGRTYSVAGKRRYRGDCP